MKNILISLFLLLAITSCQQSKVQTNTESSPMGFSVQVSDNNATRAGAQLTHTPSDVGSIGLYVFVERPDGKIEVLGENLKLNYVDGQKLWEYDDENLAPEWGYTDGSDRYTFYGYAPYSPTAHGITFDANNSEFAIDYDMDYNQDLMIAKTSGIVCPAGGIVTLSLKHTLCAISLNTTYTSTINKVELVTSDSYFASMPISGKASINESGKVEWNNMQYRTSALHYELDHQTRSYVLLLPQTTTQKGDLFFSITSTKYNTTTVDNNAKIPAMELNCSGVYKFNYKEPYYDVDDEGELVIKVDKITNNIHLPGGFDDLDALIDKIEASGSNTVVVTGKAESSDYAFHVIMHIMQNSDMENYDFSGYIIPDDARLPYGAFANQTKLKNVVMPVLKEGQLDVACFQNCATLETVKFPEGQTLTTLPQNTFSGCTSLKKVELDLTSNTLTKIDNAAFLKCSALEEMELPNTVKTIAYQGFGNCSSLSKINIPAAMTNIDGNGFIDCTSLYSYGENKGITFEQRTAQNTPITIGWWGFHNTHVRYQDIPSGYINPNTSNSGYFSEP